MTEDEWRACADPRKMSDAAANSPRASDRTCRLLVAAFWMWQAQRVADDPQAELSRRVAAMEHWAETGRLPRGVRTSRSEAVVFFNRSATRAMQLTLLAPATWGPLATDAVAVLPLLVRDIFGNPFRPVAFSPAWRTDTAVSLARTMYEARDFSAMPILADALQDAGCDRADVLAHCRDPDGVHVRGCWAVDLVLGNR
jgi:hypothetical protein